MSKGFANPSQQIPDMPGEGLIYITFHRVGETSNDLIRGSKYCRNTTRDSSATVFGNTDNHRPSHAAHADDPGDHRGDESDSGDSISKRVSGSRKTPKKNRQIHDNDDRGEPIYLDADSTLSDSIRSRRRSRSTCLSWSRVTEEPSIVCSEPDRRIFRRNTAPAFSGGKVFQIDPAAENAALAGRFVLVIGRSGSSVVCLALRRHGDLHGQEYDLLQARVRLYAKVHGDSRKQVAPEHFKQSSCPPLQLELEEGRKLFSDVWVNLAEPLTINNANDIAVEWHGALDDSDFSRLKDAYIVTQARMINSWHGAPSAFMNRLLLFWLYMNVSVGLVLW